MTFLEFVTIYWPAILGFSYFAAIPVLIGLAWLLCYLVDDGDESFTYPSIKHFPVLKDVDFTRNWLLESCLLGCVALAFLCVVDHYKSPFLIEGLCIGFATLFTINRTLRLGKALNRHINNPNAHNEEN